MDDPVLDATLRLLDAVARHGEPAAAARAAHYRRALTANPAAAIGTDTDTVSPMVDIDGSGAAPRLLLAGYKYLHERGRVTPSQESDFFVPVAEAQAALNRFSTSK